MCSNIFNDTICCYPLNHFLFNLYLVNKIIVIVVAFVGKMATLQLLDLPVDILFLILKKVPLEDKLHTLSKMPEFRPFLKHRASYLSSSAPFSLKYIDFLRQLRPGWYFNRKNGFHRMYLQINETTLHFSKFHFDLWNYQDFHRPNSHVSFYRKSIDSAKNDFGFHDLIHFSDDLLTYHLKGKGFIIVHYRSDSPWQVIYLSNLRKYMMRIDKPIVLTRFVSSYRMCNFQAKLTRNKKLIIQCVDLQKCQCVNHVQELNPISFEISNDYQYLTWDGGDRIPLMLCSDYRLEDEQYLEGFRIYHHKHPHVQTMRKIVEGDEHDKHLKKFIWRKTLKRKI